VGGGGIQVLGDCSRLGLRLWGSGFRFLDLGVGFKVLRFKV
jgi:hypothetical protein